VKSYTYSSHVFNSYYNPSQNNKAGTWLGTGWSGTAGDRLEKNWGRAGYAREGVAGAGLAAGWRLAGSRHFRAMNWLGWLGRAARG